ncbi:monovalent cation/H(+) antiporter subunit G [Gulosibacter molinativorax]|uniref:Sodium:proton antiporter n=1 Tax=Gulosibacter molinativorax TaxID=256821 RepID=A0ABT7C9V8_9MICO|nr:monovalent cation/H(+) antiporter subunit G [Gulosibacter molinativorax]MDJ1371929.1 sodium:proton antiporter [Gulosibacter molinativorax]QUY62578.1 Hypotetical protein [Gulosibacter molinativorax]
MTVADWLDIATAIFLVLGSILSLSAGIGLLRFPDMIARLHAQSKPQAAGLMFILIGLALQQTNWTVVLFIFPILLFQFITTPAAGIVLARGGYRSKHYENVPLHTDELEVEVARAQRAEEAAAKRERLVRGGGPELDSELDPNAPNPLSL